MNDKRDAQGNLLPGDQRITKIGSIIRKYSLDEMLQLVNVLIGNMSLMGPRPLEVAYLPLYTQSQARRHEVKPGITGWAQLCYPYGSTDNDARQKLQYDLYYVKNHNLLLDLIILIQTVEVVLFGKGAR